MLVASAKANCLQEWDHVNDPPCHPDDSDWNGCYTCIHRAGIAAALRAATDQVMPKLWYDDNDINDVRDQLLAIADELETQ